MAREDDASYWRSDYERGSGGLGGVTKVAKVAMGRPRFEAEGQSIGQTDGVLDLERRRTEVRKT